MYRRYRYFIYFLGALVLGSFLLDWLSNSVHVPAPRHVEDAAVAPPPADIASPPAPPADSFGPGPPPYAPAYDNSSVQDQESPKVRETPAAEQSTPPGISNSSDLQPPAPPPTASPEGPESPDRDQTTTSPKSSNAALREVIKPKGR
jgi:hypothetical protein